jgi:hypothetical protein
VDAAALQLSAALTDWELGHPEDDKLAWMPKEDATWVLSDAALLSWGLVACVRVQASFVARPRMAAPDRLLQIIAWGACCVFARWCATSSTCLQLALLAYVMSIVPAVPSCPSATGTGRSSTTRTRNCYSGWPHSLQACSLQLHAHAQQPFIVQSIGARSGLTGMHVQNQDRPGQVG